MFLARSQRPQLQLRTTLTPSQQSRRGKAFIRRRDDNGEVFFTPEHDRRNLGRTEKAPPASAFFVSPMVVLDLIQDGQRGVRDYNDEDEAALANKYLTPPSRKAARTTVNAFTNELLEQRSRAGALHKERTFKSHINNADIMSSALLGSPGKGKTQYSEEGNAETTTGGDPHGTQAAIMEVMKKNCIPERAGGSDQTLLEWMLLRRDSLAKATPVHVLTTDRLQRALIGCRSMNDVRRIVFLYLNDGLSLLKETNSKESRNYQALQSITRTCIALLDALPPGSSGFVEALTFANNLRTRVFSDKRENVPSCLSGLALRASAGAGFLERTAAEVTSLHQSTELDYDQALDDVVASLEYCLSHVESGASVSQNRREDLIQMLVGTHDADGSAGGSFRDVIRRCLKQPDAPQGIDLEAYSILLGHLMGITFSEGGSSVILKRFGVDSVNALLEKSRDELAHLIVKV